MLPQSHTTLQNDPFLPPGLRASTFQKFFRKIVHGGYLLFLGAVIAIAWSNLFPENYVAFWHTSLGLSFGQAQFSMTLAHWVNDALMTIFFFTVGLEIKREFLVGGLSHRQGAILPVSAALGGMAVPALIFTILNSSSPEIEGWAIPTATDIAFSLAVLSILGPKIPFSIRLFLTAYAIADDLGAVLIIALFYTPTVEFTYLIPAAFIIVLLGLLNRFWIRSTIPYLILGGVLWITVAAAGLHATIAGVVVAMFIPARGRYDMSIFERIVGKHLETIRVKNRESTDIMLQRSHLNAVQAIDLSCAEVETPLQRLELSLTQWVSFIILPLFALANTGLVLKGIDFTSALSHPITLGIIAGLSLGKPMGVMAATYLAVKLFRLELEPEFTWTRILGIGCLGGIGFTMSLFISGLSYSNSIFLDYTKIGIICGSAASASIGYAILRWSIKD